LIFIELPFCYLIITSEGIQFHETGGTMRRVKRDWLRGLLGAAEHRGLGITIEPLECEIWGIGHLRGDELGPFCADARRGGSACDQI
jgi:hypothetical protein